MKNKKRKKTKANNTTKMITIAITKQMSTQRKSNTITLQKQKKQNTHITINKTFKKIEIKTITTKKQKRKHNKPNTKQHTDIKSTITNTNKRKTKKKNNNKQTY